MNLDDILGLFSPRTGQPANSSVESCPLKKAQEKPKVPCNLASISLTVVQDKTSKTKTGSALRASSTAPKVLSAEVLSLLDQHAVVIAMKAAPTKESDIAVTTHECEALVHVESQCATHPLLTVDVAEKPTGAPKKTVKSEAVPLVVKRIEYEISDFFADALRFNFDDLVLPGAVETVFNFASCGAPASRRGHRRPSLSALARVEGLDTWTISYSWPVGLLLTFNAKYKSTSTLLGSQVTETTRRERETLGGEASSFTSSDTSTARDGSITMENQAISLDVKSHDGSALSMAGSSTAVATSTESDPQLAKRAMETLSKEPDEVVAEYRKGLKDKLKEAHLKIKRNDVDIGPAIGEAFDSLREDVDTVVEAFEFVSHGLFYALKTASLFGATAEWGTEVWFIQGQASVTTAEVKGSPLEGGCYYIDQSHRQWYVDLDLTLFTGSFSATGGVSAKAIVEALASVDITITATVTGSIGFEGELQRPGPPASGKIKSDLSLTVDGKGKVTALAQSYEAHLVIEGGVKASGGAVFDGKKIAKHGARIATEKCEIFVYSKTGEFSVKELSYNESEPKLLYGPIVLLEDNAYEKTWGDWKEDDDE